MVYRSDLSLGFIKHRSPNTQINVDSTTYLILPSKYSPDLNPKELKCLEIFVSSNTGDYRWPAELSKAINKFTHLTSNTFINQLECLIVNEFTFHFKHLPGFPVTVIYPKKKCRARNYTVHVYVHKIHDGFIIIWNEMSVCTWASQEVWIRDKCLNWLNTFSLLDLSYKNKIRGLLNFPVGRFHSFLIFF